MKGDDCGPFVFHIVKHGFKILDIGGPCCYCLLMEMNAARTAQGQKTLPAKYYTSQEVFQEEMEKVFPRKWICVGHVSQVPEAGSYFLREVCGENMLVTRDPQGKVHSFYNLCRHRGTRLCTEATGTFSGRIQCPYHAWTYALDGRLIGVPNMAGVQNFNMAEYPLHYVPTTVWEGLIFVNLSMHPESFADTFAPIRDRFSEWQMDHLKLAHQIVYEIQANWKLIFQNYSECYHCPTVHPLLASLTPYKSSTNHLDEGPFLGGPMQLGGETESMTVDGRACALPIESLCGDNRKLVHYYTLFPSMFLTLHPDYVMVHRVEPQTPDRTRVTCEWFFHPEAMANPHFNAMPAVEFWDITNREDWHVSELSQQGISSRAYQPGPYADLESLLAAFDREYLRSME